jgi:CHAT domain-containing protein/tetratricopeptide (TPR) repeat protein
MNIRHASRHECFVPSSNSRRVLPVLALLVFVFAGCGKSSVTNGLEALQAAYEGHRPMEARLSGRAYAPFLSRRGEPGDFDPVKRDLAERLLLEAVAEKPTSSARQALAQFHLMSGSPAKAILQLEEALKTDGQNASLRNDLGVALMEMGHKPPATESHNTLLYFAKALEEFESALRLDSTNVEALHNRALVLEKMKLPEQRDKAWQAYLAKETEQHWTAEVRHHVQILSQAKSKVLSQGEVLERFLASAAAQNDEVSWHELTRNKEMITQRFIPQELANSFLIATANKNADEAKKFLFALRYAGKLELEKASDPFVSEIAEYYAHTSAEQQKLLRNAQTLLRNGYASCLKSTFDRTPFVEAGRLFTQAGDVWEAKICDYWIAYTLMEQDKFTKSTALLTSLADFSRDRQFHWLQAQAICWLANNHTELGQYSQSIERYDEALAIASRINDSYNQQKILSQLGNSYMHLGQPERALQYDWQALEQIDPASNSVRQTWRIYLYTTRALASLNLFESASQYGAEMLDLASNELKSSPGMVHFSYLYEAQINGGKRNYDQAYLLAKESFTVADSVAGRKNRFKLQTGSMLLLAHLERQSGHPEYALSFYDEVIQNQRRLKWSIYNYDALKGRLLCYAALKDHKNFEAQLPRVLEEFEKYRLKIFEEQNQNTFFDREQSVYDLAIDHELAKHDYSGALNYSEQSRARSLLKALIENGRKKPQKDHKKAQEDVAESAGTAPLAAIDLQRQLPPNVQVLQYAVLQDKLVIWLITSKSIECKTTNIGADDLHALVSEYVKGISSGPGKAESLRPLARKLYDLVLGPFLKDLDPRNVLCIVPDKILSYLPFGALISPSSERYLINEYSLLSAPSLNVFVYCTTTAKNQGNAGPETLLSVGNPSFDHKDYPDLDDLPAAAREATGIAANYAKSYQLIGPQAIKNAIEKQLPSANVIHFAGHYVTNQSQPLLSRLVLAKQPGSENNDLTVGELVDMKLPRAKLVVLSACETSGKDYYNGEGLIGIARTFLRTGIPLVVASQWSVESESTAELMLKFHRYRKQPGASSLSALRRAQLELLEDAHGLYSDPYYWAAFTTVGGYADF